MNTILLVYRLDGLFVYNIYADKIEPFGKAHETIKNLKKETNFLSEGLDNTIFLTLRGDYPYVINLETKEATPWKMKGFTPNPNFFNYINIAIYKNYIFFPTINDGIIYYDIKQNNYNKIQHSSCSNTSIAGNQIRGVYIDNQDILWVGHYLDGISYLPLYQNSFKHFAQDYTITAFAETNVDNVVWVGTDGDGLMKIDLKQHSILEHFTTENSAIPKDLILSLHRENDKLWCGTYGSGVGCYDINAKKWLNYAYTGQIATENIYHNDIRSFCEDDNGNIYLAMHGGGIGKINKKAQSYSDIDFVKRDSSAIKSFFSYKLIHDDEGNFWATGTNGLLLIDSKGYMTECTQSKEMWNFPSSFTSEIEKDSKGRIWIGTKSGLMFIDSTKQYTQKIDLSKYLKNNEFISTLKVDHNGNVWCTSQNILIKYNPNNNSGTSYRREDGMLGKEYFILSSYRDKNNYLYFGTTNGFTRFHPDSIGSNITPPPIVLTELYLNNIPVVPGDSSILKKTIEHTDVVELKYDQTFISVSFAALNLIGKEKNEYAYKLEGVNKEWIYLGTNNRVYFTNISPGSYTLKIKASNNDGVWNFREKDLTIIVHPPWWGRSWLKTIIILFLILLLIALVYWRFNRETIKKRRLQVAVDLRTKELQDAYSSLYKQKEEISSQNEQLVQQKEMLEKYSINLTKNQKLLELQRDELEESNTMLTKSIEYARRIQNAIIPSDEFIKSIFPHSFVFYKPREIVSGDFYWATKQENKSFFSIVDCTGHGIPGAFMSMIGNTLLNEIVIEKKIHNPLEVLHYMNNYINDYINEGVISVGETSDGMDMSLLCLDNETGKVQIATAIHKFVIYRGENKDSFGGGFYSVGGPISKERRPEYNYFEFTVEEDTTIYLFTDGFKDQFGGKRFKKIGYRRFEDIIDAAQSQPIESAYDLFQTELNSWQGTIEQFDDILIAGIHLKAKR